MQHCAAFFYKDDGMVVLTGLVWLKGAFDTLTGLFDRVGIWTNVGKTVGVMFCPYQVASTQSGRVY